MTGIETSLILQGLSVVSTVAGTLSAVANENAANKAEAQAAAHNAEVARRNAAEARRSAELQAKEEREKGLRRLSNLRGVFGASGVDVSGSSLLALQEQVRETETERAKILREGELRAQGFISEAGLQQARSKTASSRSTAGTLFSGLGQAAGQAGRLATQVKASKRQESLL